MDRKEENGDDVGKVASPPDPIEIADPSVLTCKLFFYNNSLFVAQICFGLFGLVFSAVMLGKGEPPAIYLPVLTGILGWFFPSPTNRNLQNDGIREKIIMQYLRQGNNAKPISTQDNVGVEAPSEKRLQLPNRPVQQNRLEDLSAIRQDHVIDILRMLEK